MKVAIFDTHHFEQEFFEQTNKRFNHSLKFFDVRLNENTACLVGEAPVVYSFVNDRLNASTLELLHGTGVKLIALRSAGFNTVDLTAAARLGFRVVRVPEYSPYAVAEHAVGLLLIFLLPGNKSLGRPASFGSNEKMRDVLINTG